MHGLVLSSLTNTNQIPLPLGKQPVFKNKKQNKKTFSKPVELLFKVTSGIYKKAWLLGSKI